MGNLILNAISEIRKKLDAHKKLVFYSINVHGLTSCLCLPHETRKIQSERTLKVSQYQSQL